MASGFPPLRLESLPCNKTTSLHTVAIKSQPSNSFVASNPLLLFRRCLASKPESRVQLSVPGMFLRKPDKAAALKKLKSHVAMFGAWVVVVRVTPYVLHYLVGEKDELKLEL